MPLAEPETESKKEIETPKWFDFRKFRSLLTDYFEEIDLQVATNYNADDPPNSEFVVLDTLEGNALLDSTHRYAFTIGGNRDIGTANEESFSQVKARIYEIIFECIDSAALPSNIEEFKNESSELTRKLQSYFTGDLIYNFVSTYANNIMQVANLIGMKDKYRTLFETVIINPIQFLEEQRNRLIPKAEMQEQFNTPSWFDINTFEEDIFKFMLDIDLHYSQDGNAPIQVVTTIGDRLKIMADRHLSSKLVYRFTIDDKSQQCRWNSSEFSPIRYRVLEIIIQNIDFTKLPDTFQEFWDQAMIVSNIIGQRTRGDLLRNIFSDYLSLMQALHNRSGQENQTIPYNELLRDPNPRRVVEQFKPLQQ